MYTVEHFMEDLKLLEIGEVWSPSPLCNTLIGLGGASVKLLSGVRLHCLVGRTEAGASSK